MYGHAKVENLAAAIEGMLILVGAGVIVFEAVRRLVDRRGEVENIGFGIAVIGDLGGRQRRACPPTSTGRRARTTRPRSRATPRTCARTPLTSVAVLVGLVLIEVTGVEELDAIVALMVAVGDRLRGRADPEPLVARADGRGAARGGAGHGPAG